MNLRESSFNPYALFKRVNNLLKEKLRGNYQGTVTGETGTGYSDERRKVMEILSHIPIRIPYCEGGIDAVDVNIALGKLFDIANRGKNGKLLGDTVVMTRQLDLPGYRNPLLLEYRVDFNNPEEVFEFRKDLIVVCHGLKTGEFNPTEARIYLDKMAEKSEERRRKK